MLNVYFVTDKFLMISLENISKAYKTKGVHKQIFEGFNFEFLPNKNYAIMGNNGIGKSTLLRLIAGAEVPDKGRINRRGKVSWPMGFSGGFNGSMTGVENVRFVSRIYGEDPRRIIQYVYEFSELKESMSLPIRTYSSGMRSRLAFGLSLAIDFDCYLVDEIIAVGDGNFRKKSKEEFLKKFKKSFLIMASHSPSIVKDYCNCGILINSRGINYYDNIDDLLEAYSMN